MGKKLLEVFMKKNSAIKTNQKEFRKEKVLKEKVINCTSNGKVMIIVLIVGLIKKISHKNESIICFQNFTL